MKNVFKRTISICLTLCMIGNLFMVIPTIAANKGQLKKITLNKRSITLEIGKTATLTAKATPTRLKNSIKWKSSNNAVVRVSKGKVSKCKIHAKKAGTTTVKAYIGKVKVNCKVTVKSKPTLKSNSKPIPTPMPMPTPVPTSIPLYWDYWLTISSSDQEQGLVRANNREGASINYHFHNSNPWPETGITVTALPKEGFRFDGWYESGKLVSLESSYTFKYKHTNLIAKFCSKQDNNPTPMPTPEPTSTSIPLYWDYWLTVSSSDQEQGLVRANDWEGASINYHFHNSNPWPETGITVTALPKEGFRFDGWYEWGKLVSSEPSYAFKYKHMDLIANFSSELD